MSATPIAPATTIGLRRVVVAVLVGIVCLFPFGYLLLLSVTETWPFPQVLPQALSLDLWRQMLTGPTALGESLLLSLLVSTVVATCSTVAGYVTGRFMAYHPRRKALLFLAYIPFVMSPVILGTTLMYLYLKAGLVGNILGVIVGQIMFAYGFAIVFFSAFWTQRVRALEDLVYTLGGTSWQAYRRVLLPLSTGMLLICFFQTFLISWFQYGLTLLIGAGKVQTLPLKVYDYVNEANIYYAALASCLLVLPPAVLLWLNKRYVFGRGVR